MDQTHVPQLEGTRVIIKGKRTQTLRPPRPEGDQCVSRALPVNGSDAGSSNVVRSNGISDGGGCDNKIKKVKLKVGGVTRTIQPKSNSPSGSAPSKSKRPPKRRVLDSDFDEDCEDDEIQFLEKLKSSKLRKPSEDVYLEGKKKTIKKDLSELATENKKEITLTTRQRAILNKDTACSSQIEFPNGLPPAPSRKQKEKPTEVEQQLKKAEAAQRRRMQNEKAARESEAEAIRKILGQDSSRKKRQEKIKKRQEELAHGKSTSLQMLASNTIRTVMGPSGTTVTFPLEMGLPQIFDPKPSSYPPPREKCAGPFCTNDYKYRDSRLRLPLCSLRCYKAINEKLHTGNAC